MAAERETRPGTPSADGGDEAAPDAPRKRLAIMSLTALGIVYGDIGTSPLYALRECFHGEFGVPPTPANVLGVLSLVFWSLMIVVTIKYLGLALRADNHGEGGVIALLALLPHRGPRTGRSWALLLGAGLFGASLLYGDGMITPAISVLSAVEGLGTWKPALQSWVVPLTVAILAALFALQSKGTARIGAIFGPITLLWFVTIGALGLAGIVANPQVCRALLPWHALAFLHANGAGGFLVLGAVFLVVTGAEALYADMGHLGVPPIRWAWGTVVLPGLLLSYFGQGALVLLRPEVAADPFYALAPAWMLAPLIVLATVATIIASQAVISGAFSLTRQAIQLGMCPRMRIVQTSDVESGQVYVPGINWFLMLAALGLVLGFRSSSALAAAYGMAVTTTMLITTVLLSVVLRLRFGWSAWRIAPLCLLFLVVELAFFGASISKVLHGAWFPLAIGAGVFVAMSTWKKGRALLAAKLRDQLPSLADFVQTAHDLPRVPGTAVFLTSDPDTVPAAMLHNLEHNKVLHERVVFLFVGTESIPRVAREDKVEWMELGEGLHRIVAHSGFYEQPNVSHALALANEQGFDIDPEAVSYFLGRERTRPRHRPGMSRWRERLFDVLSRNAMGATMYYGIPPSRVIEIGAQVQL